MPIIFTRCVKTADRVLIYPQTISHQLIKFSSQLLGKVLHPCSAIPERNNQIHGNISQCDVG